MLRRTMLTTSACAFLLLLPAGDMVAQEERSQTGLDRLAGKVTAIERESSVIGVTYDQTTRQVTYDTSTRFTNWNQAASVAVVKVGSQVICRGKFDAKQRMAAARIEVR